MEELKNILSWQDYEKTVLQVSPDDADRLIKQWEEFARQKRPFFNINAGADERILPHPVVPVEDRTVTSLIPQCRSSLCWHFK